uniref:Uncharacterized protein n=1 Tax=Ralstonia solanacearum TaxID=305 RepID=A0A0S4TVQ6_RALSL|nr:protein of unknown function [Ralstonia solanacearum]
MIALPVVLKPSMLSRPHCRRMAHKLSYTGSVALENHLFREFLHKLRPMMKRQFRVLKPSRTENLTTCPFT